MRLSAIPGESTEVQSLALSVDTLRLHIRRTREQLILTVMPMLWRGIRNKMSMGETKKGYLLGAGEKVQISPNAPVYVIRNETGLGLRLVRVGNGISVHLQNEVQEGQVTYGFTVIDSEELPDFQSGKLKFAGAVFERASEAQDYASRLASIDSKGRIYFVFGVDKSGRPDFSQKYFETRVT